MGGKLQKIIGGLSLVLGLLIALTPFQLAPVCQRLLELTTGRMVHMRCHYTGQAEVVLGLIVMAVSLLFLFNKSISAQKSLGAVLAFLGVAVIVLPTNFGIGVCMNPMECHTTAKFLYALGSLLVISGLVGVFQKETGLSKPGGVSA